MLAALHSKRTSPMYCLNEHLNYFSESVAGKHELLKADFDEIFGDSQEVSLISKPIKISRTSKSPPASPKSVTESSPKPTQLDREKVVLSPITVTSTAIFSEGCEDTRLATERTKSRKRKISDSTPCTPSKSAAILADKEGVRRERNRQHAKRSRQRKRQFLSSLEQSVNDLRAENEKLLQLCGLPMQDSNVKTDTETAIDDVEDQAFHREFIRALEVPQNRVLSNDDLSSLRKLFSS